MIHLQIFSSFQELSYLVSYLAVSGQGPLPGSETLTCPYTRVSIGLTVSRKTAKKLAVRRKNERILTVSRKKMLTVKRSNHKIRYEVLLRTKYRTWIH